MKFIALLILSAGALVAAQTATNDAASVEGMVVRASTAEPLADVQIQLGNYTARTDSNGHFTIGNIPPGTYPLMVQRSGFLVLGRNPTIGNNSGAIARITLAPKQKVEGVQIEMVAAGIISGRVAGADGAPLVNFIIQGLRRTYQDGQVRIAPFNLPNPARTDDRGEFRVSGLPPGEYFILVQPPPAQQTVAGPLAAYYPGSRDPKLASAITVKEGEETSHVDLNLQSGMPVTISGYVVPDSPDGIPSQMSAGALPRSPELSFVTMFGLSYNATTTPPGQFTIRGFPVAAGSYDLFVSATGPAMDFFGSVPIEIGNAPISDVAVPLHAGVEIRGHVTIQGNASELKLATLPMELRSISYSTASRARNLEVSVLTAALRAQVGAGVAVAAASAAATAEKPLDSDGNFRIRSLPPGVFTIAPSLPANSCLIDVTQDGWSVLDSGIAIDGRKQEPLEVVISTACAAVEGVLLEADTPRGLGRIVLIPDPPHRHSYGLYFSTTTDAQGRFSLEGVSPGSYQLYSWRSISDNAWTDEKILAKYEGRGTPVTVTVGSRIKDLKVQRIPN